MSKPSRKEYNNFFKQNGLKLESKSPLTKLILLGTDLYVFSHKVNCYIINDLLAVSLKRFAEDYDTYQVTPYSNRLEDILWQNFEEAKIFKEVTAEYNLTDTAKEALKDALRIDIYRQTSRDYLLNNKIKPIYLSSVFDHDIGFDINPKLCFWNGQIWSITDADARLEFNDASDLLDETTQSHIGLLGQPNGQTNPLEERLRKQDHLIFVKDNLGRQGFLTEKNLDKIKSIYSPIKIGNYDNLE